MSADLLYPTLNWKDLALRLARAIEEGDQDEMADAAKDARLFERVPCPSVSLDPRKTLDEKEASNA